MIAESFERIHRSNLVGMGVLPLAFQRRPEPRRRSGLDGTETFEIEIDDDLKPRQDVKVTRDATATASVDVLHDLCRIDTPVEIEYYRNGGILHTVLRKMAKS